jgi:hypothetical protein
MYNMLLVLINTPSKQGAEELANQLDLPVEGTLGELTRHLQEK